MNKFITNNIFNGKNKYILISLFLIVIAIFIVTFPSDAKKYELILYNTYYQVQYNNLLLELFKVILPIIIIIICFEHDKSYLKALSPTIGRDKVMLLKQVNYSLIITVCFIILNAFYIIILAIFDYFLLFDENFLINLNYLYFDYILLLQLILLLSRENRKIISFLLLIIFIVINFMLDINLNITYYYLLPIYSEYYINYNYLLLYKLLYIVGLFSLNFIINRKEDY